MYICGNHSSSTRATDNARELLNSFDGDHQLEIVDVLQNPQQAEDAFILATPTLVREQPLPVRVLVGDLSNVSRVRQALNLSVSNNEDHRND